MECRPSYVVDGLRESGLAGEGGAKPPVEGRHREQVVLFIFAARESGG